MARNMLYEYEGELYPEYLKEGNAQQFIAPVAYEFCRGIGLDIGAGLWPLIGAVPHDIEHGGAYELPPRKYLYIFSSHCLEHLERPEDALRIWRRHLFKHGVLFLYLPHPDMRYWHPDRCEKHKNIWYPETVVDMLRTAGYKDIIHSQRDLVWSFSVVGWNRDEGIGQ